MYWVGDLVFTNDNNMAMIAGFMAAFVARISRLYYGWLNWSKKK